MDKLSGSSHPDEFRCCSIDGKTASATEAIFSIFIQDIRSKQYAFLGTGFFIAHEGVVMTAKHVLKAVIENDASKAAIGICHLLPNNQYMLRTIVKGFWDNNSDIAVALLDQPRHHHSLIW